jgi:ADP-ribosylglycohydrolase
MLGAITGDIVGSVYEFNNIKTTDFPLFSAESTFTDDSLMSIAVAMWLLDSDHSSSELEQCILGIANRYPNPMGGYGSGFTKWLFHPEYLYEYRDSQHLHDYKGGTRHPYNSFSNGAAMRASACGWYSQSIDDALYWGKRSAEITHNHPEGIKGAQAVAAAIYMGRHSATKQEITRFIERQFEYDLHRTCDEIRPYYRYESSCMETVPQAIVAFLDSNDFESAVRLAVSLGGDSDTLACITGGIAEAYYGCIPMPIEEHVMKLLPEEYQKVINRIRALPL